MSTKKRKPLGSAIEEFVFGDREATLIPTESEAALIPTEPELVSPAPTPTASLTPESALPGNTTGSCIASRYTTAAGSIGTRTCTYSIKGA